MCPEFAEVVCKSNNRGRRAPPSRLHKELSQRTLTFVNGKKETGTGLAS
jgi:hypothetical protein